MQERFRIFIKTSLLTCLLPLVLMMMQPAQAGQSVKLVTGNDYKPFADQSLPKGGMITAIVDQIFRNMGYIPEIEFLSWSRGYSLTTRAAVLGTFPYVKTQERLDACYFSEPIYIIVTRFFAREDADIVFEQDSDLKGLTVCKPLGYNLTDIQAFLDQGLIRLQRPNTMKSCFSMLRRGRVDLVPINEHVGWRIVRQISARQAKFRVLDKNLQEDGLHFVVSKNHPGAVDIVNGFNKTLQQMRDDGTLAEMINQYIQGR